MNSKKRRSSIRKSTTGNVGSTEIKAHLKRRISFSGINSVRVFHFEEEPKAWNNSYEILDNLNSNDNATKTQNLHGSNETENKENVGQPDTAHNVLHLSPQKPARANESIGEEYSVFSLTKDLINASYQNSRMCQIENSVDITLYESEKIFQSAQTKRKDEAISNRNSYSLEDREKEGLANMPGERTIDFMQELEHITNLKANDLRTYSSHSEKVETTLLNEYVNEDHSPNITSNKSKHQIQPVTIYMNDSIAISNNESISNENVNLDKRKTLLQATTMMQHIFKGNQNDKENINPFADVNTTQNDSCQMEIEETFSQREIMAENDKLTEFSRQQEHNDNLKCKDRKSNIKSRPTIIFNEGIECTNNQNELIENELKSRQTIYFDQQMETSFTEQTVPVSTTKSRSTINFNENIDFSLTSQLDKKTEKINILADNTKPQSIIQHIEMNTQDGTVNECNRYGAMPKAKSRLTINFNRTIETSPPNVKTVSSKFSEECPSNNKIDSSEVKQMQLKKPNVIVRRICTPLANKCNDINSLEQQRLLRYKKKLEENAAQATTSNNAMSVEVGEKEKKAEKSLNFSLNSIKDMSVSSESSSSSLIPLEFKGYGLKQLNDEIECGKLKVFPNAAKTPPIRDRKIPISISSNLHLNRLSSSSEQRKSTFLETVDMNLSLHDDNLADLQAARASPIFNFNNMTQDKENNVKCGYSHAEELLDSTSFLARAKLSDETVSCNNSKIDSTHMNKCNESLGAAESNTEKYIANSNIEIMKSNHKEIVAPNAILQGAKPTAVQQIPIINIIDCDNLKNSPEPMDISNDFDQALTTNIDNNNHYSLQQNKEIMKDFKGLKEAITTESNNQMLFSLDESIRNESITSDVNNQTEETNKNSYLSIPARRTLYFNNEMALETELVTPIDKKNNQTEIIGECIKSSNNATRKTLYFNKTIPLENELLLAQTESRNHQAEIADECKQNSSNTARKTIYFNNEITEENSTMRIEEEIQTNATRVHKNYKISNMMTLNEHVSIEAQQKNHSFPNKDRLDIPSPDATKTNKCDADKTKLLNSRKTINNSEFLELSLTEDYLENTKAPDTLHMLSELSVDNVQPLKNNSKHDNGQELNLTKENQPFAPSPQDLDKDKRKTVYYGENNNNMSLDQSFQPAEHFKFPESIESLSVPKIILSGEMNKKTLTEKKLKLSDKQEMSLVTPKRCPGSNIPIYCITPRLSLLEFTALEKKLTEDDCIQSPLRVRINKRLTANLTPVFSMPKKRQTLIFDDCLLEESVMAPPQLERSNSPQEKQNEIERAHKGEEEMQYIRKNTTTNDDVMMLSGIQPNESVLQTLRKDRISPIPISVNNKNKSNKVLSLTTSNVDNPREADENLGESIQLMRKIDAFSHRNEITNRQLELEANKPSSVFEGNPITISDVSVYFEAQRKGNVALNKTSELTANQIENPNKNVVNRYLHLTLEDIDKTCLSLVRLSCDDTSESVSSPDSKEEDQQSPLKDVVENQSDLKPKRMNDSLLCGKCKRCQETLINETSSSISEPFVLPRLPATPDLGLERLRRLRKRPLIADVHVLWHRLSLDHTVIDISDDDSDLENEVEEENSDLIKCLRDFENDMNKLEMDLLQEENMHPFTKLPLVLRLNTLLRTHSTNWIFDYQMQHRGKLLFTYRKMLTFALALTYDEVDPLGHEINIKSIKLEKHYVAEKNWKPIDFVLDFQLKINLPYDLQCLCKGNSEIDILAMLQEIDRVCMDTVKMGNTLQRISFGNQATIVRDELRTYVRKIVRTIDNSSSSEFKPVKKTVVKVELLNLKSLSFKNIFYPQLHHFHEEIQLLPTGLEFLKEFLPNALNYIKDH